jgi:hypothetical protein
VSVPLKRKAYCPLNLLLLLEITWTVADPKLLLFACEVAVTVTAEPGAAAGAVYRPVPLMVPQEDGHAVPERLQFTDLLLLPVTVAANCCCVLTTTWAV